MVVQNMPRSSSDHSFPNNINARKYIPCYVCEKGVKESHLSSHLLFGSVQCRKCDKKWRRCKDFDSFRRSKDKDDSSKCVHRDLKWTRASADYLERKMQKDVTISKSGQHQPTTEEVTTAVKQYVRDLKSIKYKSPWRRAIRKLKKRIPSIKKETDDKQSNHDEVDKHSGSDSPYKYDEDNDVDTNKPYHRYIIEEKLNVEDEKECYPSFARLTDVNGLSKEDMVIQHLEEYVIQHTEWNIDAHDLREFQSCSQFVEISLGDGFNDEIPFLIEEVSITKDAETSPMTLIVDNKNFPLNIIGEEVPETVTFPSPIDDRASQSLTFCETITPKSVESPKNKTTLDNNVSEKTSDAFKKVAKCKEENVEIGIKKLNEYQTRSQQRMVNETELPKETSNTKSMEYEQVSESKTCSSVENRVTNSLSFWETTTQKSLESLKKITNPKHDCNILQNDTGNDALKRVEKFGEGNIKTNSVTLREQKTENQQKLRKKTKLSKENNDTKSIGPKTITFDNQIPVRNGMGEKLALTSLNVSIEKHSQMKRANKKKHKKRKTTISDKMKKRCDSKLNSEVRKSGRLKNAVHENNGSVKDILLKYPKQDEEISEVSTYNLRRKRNYIDSDLKKLDSFQKRKLRYQLLPIARKLQILGMKSNDISPSTLLPSDFIDEKKFSIEGFLSHVFDIQNQNRTNDFSFEDKMNHSSDDEIVSLFDQIERTVRQFINTQDKRKSEVAVNVSKLCGRRRKSKDRVDAKNANRKIQVESNSERLIHTKFGKYSEDQQTKAFYITPPSDYYYIMFRYQSQKLITECPMCYYRVFPSMFSINLVANIAATVCVGCMLTIYVIPGPDNNNSFPKIVFRNS